MEREERSLIRREVRKALRLARRFRGTRFGEDELEYARRLLGVEAV